MADFLTRLAARTMGAAPVIQPRVASMYASTGAGETSDVEVSSEGRYAPEHSASSSLLDLAEKTNRSMISPVIEYTSAKVGEAPEVEEHMIVAREDSSAAPERTTLISLAEPVGKTSKEMIST